MIFDDPSLIVVIAVLAVAAALLVWSVVDDGRAKARSPASPGASLNNL